MTKKIKIKIFKLFFLTMSKFWLFKTLLEIFSFLFFETSSSKDKSIKLLVTVSKFVFLLNS